VETALTDLTNRGEVVIDPFLGAGAALIAADNAGRVCRGIELDPRYVDVTIRRYEAVTRKAAVLTKTDETFATLAARRAEGLLILTADGDLL
jgi:DNA modification methylase